MHEETIERGYLLVFKQRTDPKSDQYRVAVEAFYPSRERAKLRYAILKHMPFVDKHSIRILSYLRDSLRWDNQGIRARFDGSGSVQFLEDVIC